ncbi:hypothetical protein [Burkholderia sp. IMCC1007]|uniref:hypothetical protein n=1 Tax=Burkholderia sp. IMCC1007 TaxID=3004104 RepID=UPI0022B2D7C5|nr:hypothetical protein [Burkholderia sp. IMCC1007]
MDKLATVDATARAEIRRNLVFAFTIHSPQMTSTFAGSRSCVAMHERPASIGRQIDVRNFAIVRFETHDDATGRRNGYVGISRRTRCADRRAICFAVRRKMANSELARTIFYGEHAGMQSAERLASETRRLHRPYRP